MFQKHSSGCEVACPGCEAICFRNIHRGVRLLALAARPYVSETFIGGVRLLTLVVRCAKEWAEVSFYCSTIPWKEGQKCLFNYGTILVEGGAEVSF